MLSVSSMCSNCHTCFNAFSATLDLGIGITLLVLGILSVTATINLGFSPQLQWAFIGAGTIYTATMLLLTGYLCRQAVSHVSKNKG